MSSILKALKKVENDNASRRPDELRIDAEILRTENRARFSPSGMLLVSLLLMACGAGGTYLYMKQDKTPEQATPHPGVISGLKRKSVPVAPVIPAEQLPPAIVVVPAQRQLSAEGDPVKRQLPSRPEKSAPVVVKRPLVAVPPVLTPQRSTTPPATQKIRAVPALRVNGIAFQDDGSGSVAMINGEPLTRGGIVNGVTVEEIYKNRVKFSYHGELFEVPLGQSNQ